MDQNEVEVSGQILVILCHNLILVCRRKRILKTVYSKNFVKIDFYIQNFCHSNFIQICIEDSLIQAVLKLSFCWSSEFSIYRQKPVNIKELGYCLSVFLSGTLEILLKNINYRLAHKMFLK